MRQPKPVKQYATVLREQLAEHRRNGLPFERAWALTTRKFPAPSSRWEGWSPEVLHFAKRKFKLGYERSFSEGGNIGILTEHDVLCKDIGPCEVVDFPACRWGGDPCGSRPVAGSRFCGPHRERLHAAVGRSVPEAQAA